MTDEHIKAWPLTPATEAEIMDDFNETGILSRTQSYLLLGAHAHWRKVAEAGTLRDDVAERQLSKGADPGAFFTLLTRVPKGPDGRMFIAGKEAKVVDGSFSWTRGDDDPEPAKAREQVSASADKCTTCHGSGVRRGSRGFQSVVLDCSACDGSGKPGDVGQATSPAIPQASRDRLTCFFYLLTRGIPDVRGMAWGDVKPIVRTAASTTENTYTSAAGLALATELVDELIGRVSQ